MHVYVERFRAARTCNLAPSRREAAGCGRQRWQLVQSFDSVRRESERFCGISAEIVINVGTSTQALGPFIIVLSQFYSVAVITHWKRFVPPPLCDRSGFIEPLSFGEHFGPSVVAECSLVPFTCLDRARSVFF